MGFQHPLQDRSFDRHGGSLRLLDLCGQLRSHQGCHAGGPGDPDVALLAGEAEDQRLGPGAIDQRPLFLWLN